MFGGVLSSENYNSKVYVEKCIFEKNFAYFFTVSGGGGNAICIKGNLFTKFETKKCIIQDSGISSRGI